MDQISFLFGKLLFTLYNFSGHYGIAIILFTIITRIILLPLTILQIRSSQAMKMAQPLISAVNKKYKDNPQKQSEKLSEIYKKYKINPVSGCLPLLIQLPIIVALFKAMREPAKYVFASEAAFKAADAGFLWMKSLARPDVIALGSIKLPFILPVITAVLQFIQTKQTMGDQSRSEDKAQSMQNTMLYVFPVLMLFWGISFPSGLMLYWAFSAVFQIAQQAAVEKLSPVKNAEVIEEDIETEIEKIEKEEQAAKKKKRPKIRRNESFYDEYSHTNGKEKKLKRVRRIPKSAIIKTDEAENQTDKPENEENKL